MDGADALRDDERLSQFLTGTLLERVETLLQDVRALAEAEKNACVYRLLETVAEALVEQNARVEQLEKDKAMLGAVVRKRRRKAQRSKASGRSANSSLLTALCPSRWSPIGYALATSTAATFGTCRLSSIRFSLTSSLVTAKRKRKRSLGVPAV